MKDRISWFRHYNLIYIIPSIQICYERIDRSFKFNYLDIDVIWFNLGISITIIKEK